MKFNGSVLGKIVGAFLCILLGIIIGLGAEVGAIYYIFTSSTVGWVADKVSPSLPESVQLEFSDEVRAMSIANWTKELVSATADMDNTTVGKLESLIGYSAISNALSEVIGTDKEVIKGATFNKLGATISESMTLGTVSAKFEIALPDMPLFKDDTFLNAPLNTAFEGLTQKPLNMFVVIDDDTNVVLKKIQDLTIDELGGERLTETINTIKLGEVVNIEEGVSNNVLVALKDVTIGEMGGEGASDLINSMFMYEIVDITDESEGVMKAMKYATLESKKTELTVSEITAQDTAFRASAAYTAAHAKEVEGYEYVYSSDGTAYVYVTENGERVLNTAGTAYVCYETKEVTEKVGTENVVKNRPIVGINDTIKTTTIGELMDLTEDDKPMWSLRNSTLDSISDDLNKLFLDEIMDIDAGSSKTIQALRYAALKTSGIKVAAGDIANHSETDKELPGYVYKYVSDGKGGYIAYVAVIGEDGRIVSDAQGISLIETKLYDNYYRPLVSLDSKINELFIGELIDDPESQTLKSISKSSLSSVKSYINKTEMDTSTASYVTGHPDHATYEDEEFTYKYSALGLAYVCVEDEDGEPVVDDGKYVLYNTKIYDGKYYPLRGIDDKMDTMTMGEVIVIDEHSSNLLKSLKDTRINDMDNAVNKLFMCEMMEIDGGSAQVLKAIKYTALKDSVKYIKVNDVLDYATEVPAEIKSKETEEYAGRYFFVTEKGNYVAYVALLDEFDNPVTEIIDGNNYYKVYEIKEIDGKLYPIISLDNKLGKLVLSDVFSDTELNSGVLGLLDSDTEISHIGSAVSEAMKDSSLSTLIGVDVLDDTSIGNMNNTGKRQRSFMMNSNLSDMIKGMMEFVNDPTDVSSVTIGDKDLTGNYASLTAFVNDYTQHQTLILKDEVTVTVDATLDAAYYNADDGKYYIPVFSLERDDSNHQFNFAGGNVVLCLYDDSGISKHQYYYAYDDSNNGMGSGLSYFNGTGTVAAVAATSHAGIHLLEDTFMEVSLH